jgi:hypothetical protein
MADPINPEHYKGGGLQAIDVIETFGLGFNLGNVVKYTLRAGKKGEKTEDLKKAIWYLKREMDLEAEKVTTYEVTAEIKGNPNKNA